MAQAGGPGVLCVSRGTHEFAGTWRIPLPRNRSLAAHASAAQPKGRHDMGANEPARRCLAPQTSNPSSVARPAFRRQTPEVGARCQMWRLSICGADPPCAAEMGGMSDRPPHIFPAIVHAGTPSILAVLAKACWIGRHQWEHKWPMPSLSFPDQFRRRCSSC